MAIKVRILRRSVPFQNSLQRVLNLFNVFLSIKARNLQGEIQAQTQGARLRLIDEQIQIAQARREKLVSENVMLDLKIEEKRRELGYPPEPN